MSPPVDALLARLANVKPSGAGFTARCSAHEDRHNSLKIDVGRDGQALIHCFAGCDTTAVVAAIGLSLADLYPPKESTVRQNGHGRSNGHARRLVGTTRYQIRDEAGLVAVHVRDDYSDGSKVVWWERDGQRGLGGLPSADLPLYGVHELGDAIEVVVTEGEKASEAVRQLGVPAVGTVTGASGCPGDESLRPLVGRIVSLWPDHDQPGRDHVNRIAERLRALGQQAELIRLITWPDVPAGGDAADFVATGGTVEGLRRLMAAAAPWKPTTGPERAAPERRVRFLTARQFAEATPDQTEWVVEPFVPTGGVTKIDGPPKKAGKTTLITHMVRAALTGTDFLGKPAKRGAVVLLTEQGGTSFREALARAGLLDRDDLYLATYRDLASHAWPDVVSDAFALAVEVGAVLLVVDTLPAVSRVRGDDENSAGRALEALEPLQVGADAHRLGVVVSFHDRKGGGEVGESGRGSSAYAGAVDVILHVNRPGGNLKPTVRKIEALSRFEATPEELYVELTPSGYVSLGTENDVVTALVAGTLADVLPKAEEEAKPVGTVKRDGEVVERGLLDDLADRGVKAARSTLDAELARWLSGRYVGRAGEGKKGSPFRYWLVAMPPPEFFRSKPSPPSEERNAEQADPSQSDSSDAPPPSEESNGGGHAGATGGPMLSSDAPDGYSGRKHPPAAPADPDEVWEEWIA